MIQWKKDKVFITCISIIIFFFILTSINPSDRHAWFFEAIAVIIFIPILTATKKNFRFSDSSYILMTFYMVLVMIGGYFLFANVPLPFTNFFGERNPYDRIVHFSSGLLLTYPVYELFTRTSKTKNFWIYLIPLIIIMGAGAIYEILEWAAGNFSEKTFENLQASAQGDIFDAQRDMLMNFIGSLIATSVIFLKNKNKK